MKALNTLLIGLILTASAAAGQQLGLAPESQLWLEGSSSVNRFKCGADSLRGSGSLARGATVRVEWAELDVYVDSIDCGNDRISADLRETLGSERHPRILFELTDTGRGTSAGIEDLQGMPLTISVTGLLTISGQTRQIDLEGTVARLESGAFRLEGSKRLLLTDFGIKPPTKLLGLIKVRNEIDVRFNLIAARREPMVSIDSP